jgi:hypothetical protein
MVVIPSEPGLRAREFVCPDGKSPFDTTEVGALSNHVAA